MGVWSYATRSIDTEQKQDVPSIFSTLLATGASSSYSLQWKKEGEIISRGSSFLGLLKKLIFGSATLLCPLRVLRANGSNWIAIQRIACRPTWNFFRNRQYEWNTTRSSISPPVAVFDFVLNRLSKSCRDWKPTFAAIFHLVYKEPPLTRKICFSSTRFELKLELKIEFYHHEGSNFIQTIDDKATIS
jgi:hypothetical protein